MSRRRTQMRRPRAPYTPAQYLIAKDLVSLAPRQIARRLATLDAADRDGVRAALMRLDVALPSWSPPAQGRRNGTA